MSKSRGETNASTNEADINLTKLNLLITVNEFKKDVRITRLFFKIPESGFSTQDALKFISKGRYFDSENQSLDPADAVTSFNPDPKTFKGKIYQLGLKYKLPLNFYNTIGTGVPYYVLANTLVPPSKSWEVNFAEADFTDSQLIQVRIFNRLSDADFEEIKNKVKFLQKRVGFDELFKKINLRTKFKRDLALLQEYKSKDSYTVANKNQVSFSTVRQAKVRLNKLAKDLFGYGIEL
jgi:hypothetical protein